MTKRVIYDTSKPLTPEERANAIDGSAELIGDDDFEFVDYGPNPLAEYSPEDFFIVMGKQIVDRDAAAAIALYMEIHPEADREQVTAEIEAAEARYGTGIPYPGADYSRDGRPD